MRRLLLAAVLPCIAGLSQDTPDKRRALAEGGHGPGESDQCAGQIQNQLDLVSAACCDDSATPGGHRRTQGTSCDAYPAECTKACAMVFVPFVDDCTPQLVDAQVDLGHEFGAFDTLCSDSLDTHPCEAGHYEYQHNALPTECVALETNLIDAGMSNTATGDFFFLFFTESSGNYGRAFFHGDKTVAIYGRRSDGSTDTRVTYNGRLQPMSAGVSLTLDGLIFASQSTTGRGGAIAVNDHSMVTVKDCVFDNNNAVWDGGAISVSGGSSLNVVDCVFTSNHAVWYGGAISLRSDSLLSVTGSFFSANDATDEDAVDQSVELGDAIYYPRADGTLLIYTDATANTAQPIN